MRWPRRPTAIFSRFSPFPFVANAMPDIRGQHREDQKPSDDIVLSVAGDVGKTHSVAKIENDKDRDADAGEIALASENAHPSEQDRGDDVELKSFGGAPAHRSQARSIED